MDAVELTSRARDFTLASVLASYPDDELEETLGSVAHALDGHPGAQPMIERLHRGADFDDVRSAYLELFDRGGDRASLYETEYGRMRGMSKGNELADIAGFYEAFGLALDAERTHEMLDHIAVELEFYALLLLKQLALGDKGDAEGTFVVEDARRKFMKDHLGRFAKALADRRDVKEHPVYGPVFAWCWDVVARECSALGVEPAPLDFYSDADGKEELKCGSVRLPVVD